MARIRVKESERPRAGRRFAPVAEQALRRDALQAAKALRGAASGLAVYGEVAGPFGIPDFLAVTGARLVLRQRLAADIPPLLNEVDAGIVANLTPSRGRAVDVLSARLGWEPDTIQRRLPALLRSAAVRRIGDDRFVRHRALVPVGHLHALETKVRDFRRALRQARTYALWCENYVIVMQELRGPSLENAADLVAADRGGLVVAGRWIQRPGARRLSSARALWGSEHLVAAASRPKSPALGGREPGKT